MRCELMTQLVMSDFTHAHVTSCSLALLSLMRPAAISDLIREEGPQKKNKKSEKSYIAPAAFAGNKVPRPNQIYESSCLKDKTQG